MTKVKQMNKLLVIQWNDKIIRQDIGEQKIDAREWKHVLECCIKELEEAYGI